MGLVDVEVVRDWMLEVFTALNEFVPEPVEDVATPIEEASDELLTLLVAENLGIYHQLEGVVLETGENKVEDDHLQSPFGGEIIPAYASLEIVDTVDQDGCVKVESVIRPEPAGLIAMVSELVGGELSLTDEEAEEMAEELSVEVSAVGQYDYYEDVFKRIVATKTIVSPAGDIVQTITISDVTDASNQ